jgi:hypothetical protein
MKIVLDICLTVVHTLSMPRENRVRTAGFRVTSSEWKLIEQQAKKLDLRLSEYVRLCVFGDITTRRQNDAKETASTT